MLTIVAKYYIMYLYKYHLRGGILNQIGGYSTLADAQLATLYQNGDNAAFDELALRYFGKIGAIARKYSAKGYEHSDFVQEGLFALMRACATYSSERGMSFKNYASVVVERRFITVVRAQLSQKAVPESALVGLDDLDGDIEDASGSPEGQLVREEQFRLMLEKLRGILSKTEYTVLMLHVEGHSYAEIAGRLGMKEKAVDNALQRVRKKCRRLKLSLGSAAYMSP